VLASVEPVPFYVAARENAWAGVKAHLGTVTERAAAPSRVPFPFLIYPVAGLLGRHARHGTKHEVLIWQVLDQLAGASKRASPAEEPARLPESLSTSETRMLRCLPPTSRFPRSPAS
jgi:hypothetical protein